MLANLTAVAPFWAAWWMRGGAVTRPDAIVLGLEVLGLGLLGDGGYMGGTLVTRDGKVKAGPAKKKIAVYRVREEEGEVRLIL